jgi:hypothetical protein
MKRYYFLLLAIGFISCERELLIDLPYAKPALVLHSFVVPDNIILARLNKLINYTETPANPRTNLNNVEVDLYENDAFIERLTPKEINQTTWYVATRKSKAGARYKITGRATGFDAVEAEDIAPEEPNIHGLQIRRVPKEVSTLSFQITDRAKEKNYYRLVCLTHPVNSIGSMNIFSVLELEQLNITNGNAEVDVFNQNSTYIGYFDDEQFDGKTITINFLNSQKKSPSYFSTADSIVYTCELTLLTKSSYTYLRSVALQNNATREELFTNLLGQLPVVGNVKNGYGVVSGMSVSNLSATIKN